MRKLLIFILVSLCAFFLNSFADPIRTKPLPGTIALTFDDGPAPFYTEEILKILRHYHVRATFFMVGASAAKYPDLVKKVQEEGHVIASHSQTHPMLTKLSEQSLNREISKPQQIIQRITGKSPACLRYPFGASNAFVRHKIKSYNITPVAMGFNSFDYERPGTNKIVNWVLKNSYSKQIILLHDGFNLREQTIAALPKIIEGIQKKGLGFSVICE